MYAIRSKSMRGAPTCLLHPGAEIRWASSFRRYGAWTCDGCRAERAAREVQRAKPPVPLHRSRPARPLDEATVSELVERLFALAIPTDAVHVRGSLDAVDVAERLLAGLVPDVAEVADQARDVAYGMRRRSEARYKSEASYTTSLEREDVVQMAEIGRQDAASGTRDLRKAWLVRRAAMARRDPSRAGHVFPWSAAQLAAMKRIYLAYATDEARRLAPCCTERARILLPVARALLTKPILVLPRDRDHILWTSASKPVGAVP